MNSGMKGGEEGRIRDYRESDFETCVHLVNKVWKFDDHFSPAALSRFFQKVYVGGALGESNSLEVVEHDGRVMGFLFGKKEKGGK